MSKPNDLTTIGKVELPKSLGGALMTEAATPDATVAEVRVNAEVKLSEENGTIASTWILF